MSEEKSDSVIDTAPAVPPPSGPSAKFQNKALVIVPRPQETQYFVVVVTKDCDEYQSETLVARYAHPIYAIMGNAITITEFESTLTWFDHEAENVKYFIQVSSLNEKKEKSPVTEIPFTPTKKEEAKKDEPAPKPTPNHLPLPTPTPAKEEKKSGPSLEERLQKQHAILCEVESNLRDTEDSNRIHGWIPNRVFLRGQRIMINRVLQYVSKIENEATKEKVAELRNFAHVLNEKIAKLNQITEKKKEEERMSKQPPAADKPATPPPPIVPPADASSIKIPKANLIVDEAAKKDPEEQLERTTQNYEAALERLNAASKQAQEKASKAMSDLADKIEKLENEKAAALRAQAPKSEPAPIQIPPPLVDPSRIAEEAFRRLKADENTLKLAAAEKEREDRREAELARAAAVAEEVRERRRSRNRKIFWALLLLPLLALLGYYGYGLLRDSDLFEGMDFKGLFAPTVDEVNKLVPGVHYSTNQPQAALNPHGFVQSPVNTGSITITGSNKVGMIYIAQNNLGCCGANAAHGQIGNTPRVWPKDYPPTRMADLYNPHSEGIPIGQSVIPDSEWVNPGEHVRFVTPPYTDVEATHSAHPSEYELYYEVWSKDGKLEWLPAARFENATEPPVVVAYHYRIFRHTPMEIQFKFTPKAIRPEK